MMNYLFAHALPSISTLYQQSLKRVNIKQRLNKKIDLVGLFV